MQAMNAWWSEVIGTWLCTGTGYEFHLRRDGTAFYRAPDGKYEPMDGYTTMEIVETWARVNWYERVDVALDCEE